MGVVELVGPFTGAEEVRVRQFVVPPRIFRERQGFAVELDRVGDVRWVCGVSRCAGGGAQQSFEPVHWVSNGGESGGEGYYRGILPALEMQCRATKSHCCVHRRVKKMTLTPFLLTALYPP